MGNLADNRNRNKSHARHVHTRTPTHTCEFARFVAVHERFEQVSQCEPKRHGPNNWPDWAREYHNLAQGHAQWRGGGRAKGPNEARTDGNPTPPVPHGMAQPHHVQSGARRCKCDKLGSLATNACHLKEDEGAPTSTNRPLLSAVLYTTRHARHGESHFSVTGGRRSRAIQAPLGRKCGDRKRSPAGPRPVQQAMSHAARPAHTALRVVGVPTAILVPTAAAAGKCDEGRLAVGRCVRPTVMLVGIHRGQVRGPDPPPIARCGTPATLAACVGPELEIPACRAPPVPNGNRHKDVLAVRSTPVILAAGNVGPPGGHTNTHMHSHTRIHIAQQPASNITCGTYTWALDWKNTPHAHSMHIRLRRRRTNMLAWRARQQHAIVHRASRKPCHNHPSYTVHLGFRASMHRASYT